MVKPLSYCMLLLSFFLASCNAKPITDNGYEVVSDCNKKFYHTNNKYNYFTLIDINPYLSSDYNPIDENATEIEFKNILKTSSNKKISFSYKEDSRTETFVPTEFFEFGSRQIVLDTAFLRPSVAQEIMKVSRSFSELGLDVSFCNNCAIKATFLIIPVCYRDNSKPSLLSFRQDCVEPFYIDKIRNMMGINDNIGEIFYTEFVSGLDFLRYKSYTKVPDYDKTILNYSDTAKNFPYLKISHYTNDKEVHDGFVETANSISVFNKGSKEKAVCSFLNKGSEDAEIREVISCLLQYGLKELPSSELLGTNANRDVVYKNWKTEEYMNAVIRNIHSYNTCKSAKK